MAKTEIASQGNRHARLRFRGRRSQCRSIAKAKNGTTTADGFDNRAKANIALASVYLRAEKGSLDWLRVSSPAAGRGRYQHKADSENTALNSPRVSLIQATDSTCNGCTAKHRAPAHAASRLASKRESSRNTSITHVRCKARLPA